MRLSCVVRIIVGRVIMTRAKAPAMRLVPRPRVWQKTIMPTRAKMMLGIPESVSVANSMTLTSFLFVAYSVRYMALPTPRGRMMISVQKMT